ncbi:S41 family peptidase [Dyadobacter fanqingshengii]|uniref:S41 family peptidase n=1 Tax=Dyadobacter fanqingshengii TaxID=2906443 RepID=A0A9X1PCU1_9BACT|nr:S41 family peptidase [Dyadobacter fanqingshengii]MCF0041578.1 S41 family peptidase [Dyadobacter fanqingshengii]USJ36705.1 S41 family peptidase [Dyadobacter fanqingshengii]
MKVKGLSIFFCISLVLYTCHTVSAQQQCNCLANLDTTIKKTELNYVGYPDMIARKLLPQYTRQVAKLRKDAAKESDPVKCFPILNAYVSFFNDKHFDIEYSITDTTRFQYNYLNEDAFKKDFTTQKRDSIEGIWVNPDSSMKLAVQKISPTLYQAVVLQSKDPKIKPGLVYYTFTRDKNGFVFNRYDWMTPDFPVRQRGGLLFVWNFEVWAKAYPSTITEYERSEFLTWRNYNFGLDCKKLDNDHVLLSIGSFNRDDKIKEIIQKNDSLIRSTKNLIVDLRGNGGGNSGWTYLLPYFYTQPIVQGNTYLRLSPDNIESNLPGIKTTYEKPPKDTRLMRSYTPTVLDQYKKAYEEIPLSKDQFYSLPSLTLYSDSILKTPEKIALVFDDLGGSSTEYFFYISMQSKKIKRYGERTLGMMDYMGVSQQTKLPFEDYYLLIPDRKAAWTDTKPTNKTGFVPEHDLRHIPRHKWIDYIKTDLGKL